MGKVDLTLGHIRASKGMRDGNVVNASVEGLGDLRARPPVGLSPLPLFPSTPFETVSVPPPATECTRLVGAYRRKCGKELRYTYSGSYWADFQGTSWMVTVRCKRQLRGMSTGTLKSTASPSEADLRAVVERSIEELSQIRE